MPPRQTHTHSTPSPVNISQDQGFDRLVPFDEFVAHVDHQRGRQWPGVIGSVVTRVPGSRQRLLRSQIRTLITQEAHAVGGVLAVDGPDRYAFLLPELSLDAARHRMDSLLQRIGNLEARCGSRRVKITVGGGLEPLTGKADRRSSADSGNRLHEITATIIEATALAEQSARERSLHAQVARAPHPVRTALRPWSLLYFRVARERRPLLLAAVSLALAWLAPFAVYTLLWLVAGVDIASEMFWLVFTGLLFTALTMYAECFHAFDPAVPPEEPLEHLPPATAIVAAYLPNEVDTIVETTRHLLGQDYDGDLQVIVAYNSPTALPIENDLRLLVASDRRLTLLRVGDSTSKAQNINAALQITTGDFVGIFDADHCPVPYAFRRAAGWMAAGVDYVQGQSSVRNGGGGWLPRMVAVEFSAIYAVSHPGRAALHGFAIFGGSNGYWRTDLLRRLRMRPDMLTEDIDVSMRAVLQGAKTVMDPQLVSYELAPTSISALWAQRMRWAHGWHQISRKHLGAFLRRPGLTRRQRAGGAFLLGWREVYPWIASQMLPIIAFQVLIQHRHRIHWLLPLFIASALYVNFVGPLQATVSWRLSVPLLRKRTGWFLHYLFVTGVLFGEANALVNRAAHLREAAGDTAWTVTPRGRDPKRPVGTATDMHSSISADRATTLTYFVAGKLRSICVDDPAPAHRSTVSLP